MSTHELISETREEGDSSTVMEQVRELLTSDVSDSLFDRPLGPHADCFSTSQVVRMFEAGASSQELGHLLGCPICHEIVMRSSKISQALDVGRERGTSEGVGRVVREFIFRRPRSVSPSVGAVVGLTDPLVRVDDPQADITVTCELMPCSNVDRIDPSSLKLEGAIAADSGVLTLPRDERTFPKVTFRRARLSKEARRSLAHNARVLEEIRVSGSLTGEQTSDAFVGQAKVELVRPL
jgi:hypothetical protein